LENREVHSAQVILPIINIMLYNEAKNGGRGAVLIFLVENKVSASLRKTLIGKVDWVSNVCMKTQIE
jgi:hypothetical protein